MWTKEKCNAYHKAYYETHKDIIKEHRKTQKEKHRANMKAWRLAHKDYQKVYRETFKDERIAYSKEYTKKEINLIGQTKSSIRAKSKRILKNMNMNIPGYEIHHCFGYEDPSKFIYISKSLHLKIHQFLRDNNIDAGSDHWMQIRDIVNSTDEFMYIKC